MGIKRTLRKYSGYILIAPAIMPFFLAFDGLAFTIPAYYHFLRHDVLLLRQCTISETGHLVLQDDPQSRYYRTTDGIPCVYEPVYGFRSVDYLQQLYTLRFIQAAMLIFAGVIILFIFFRTRRALSARGLLPSPSSTEF